MNRSRTPLTLWDLLSISLRWMFFLLLTLLGELSLPGKLILFSYSLLNFPSG